MKKHPANQLIASSKTSIVRGHLQAGITSLKRITRTPVATLMTIAVMAIALSLPLGLLMLLHNSKQFSKNWHGNTQISLYLKKTVNKQQASQLVNQLRVKQTVARVQYISPAQGLSDFEQRTKIGKVLSQLSSNPIPAVIEVVPTANLNSTRLLQPLLTQLKRMPQVAQTQLDMQWVQRLFSIINFITRAVYAIGFLLIVAVLLIIGNTMRLTLQQAQREIKVMQLLGASKAFIQRPFLYSGMLYGIFGGILAWIITDSMLAWLNTPIRALLLSYQNHYIPHGLPGNIVWLLLVVSSLLGIVSAGITVAYHLRSNQYEGI